MAALNVYKRRDEARESLADGIDRGVDKRGKKQIQLVAAANIPEAVARH